MSCAALAKRPTSAMAALEAQLAAIGFGAGGLIAHHEQPWRSATFSGARHRLTYRFVGRVAVARGIEAIGLLPDHEFSLPGRLVADAAMISANRVLEQTTPCLTAEIELLLLEDA